MPPFSGVGGAEFDAEQDFWSGDVDDMMSDDDCSTFMIRFT